MNNLVEKTKQVAINIKNDIVKHIDYCSGVPDLNLNSCCKEHDLNYRVMGKFKADWKFLACGWKKARTYTKPWQKNATRTIISGYYIGVTILGWIPYFKAQRENKNA